MKKWLLSILGLVSDCKCKNQQTENSKVVLEPTSKITPSVPKGWYVLQSGQDPLHMLWYLILISFDDVAEGKENPRTVSVEEFNSFHEALKEVNLRVKREDWDKDFEEDSQ